MKLQNLLKLKKLAGVEYSGSTDATANCVRAVARLIYSGLLLEKAYLITYQQHHAFILFDRFDDIFVIKNGFTSGYDGEGPEGLSATLYLLDRHRVDVEEYEVDRKLMKRLECTCLLQRDFEWLRNAKPVRPRRLTDYRCKLEKYFKYHNEYLSAYCPPSIPFSLVDDRIMDLAVAFNENEDSSIVAAYRRLEDIIRARVNLTDSGTKLFSRAFLSDNSPLTWEVKDENEARNRANMFTAIFGAFRNARMHREQRQKYNDALREFLLINELFLLEGCAIPRC